MCIILLFSVCDRCLRICIISLLDVCDRCLRMYIILLFGVCDRCLRMCIILLFSVCDRCLRICIILLFGVYRCLRAHQELMQNTQHVNSLAISFEWPSLKTCWVCVSYCACFI